MAGPAHARGETEAEAGAARAAWCGPIGAGDLCQDASGARRRRGAERGASADGRVSGARLEVKAASRPACVRPSDRQTAERVTAGALRYEQAFFWPVTIL